MICWSLGHTPCNVSCFTTENVSHTPNYTRLFFTVWTDFTKCFCGDSLYAKAPKFLNRGLLGHAPRGGATC